MMDQRRATTNIYEIKIEWMESCVKKHVTWDQPEAIWPYLNYLLLFDCGLY